MDVFQTKFNFNCPKHPNYRLEFLQVDNLNNNQLDKNLFCCSACANQDSTFRHSNYELIQEIIQSGTDQILPKWPPVNDDQLMSQLIQIQKGQEDFKAIETKILSYFTELKQQIQSQIDNCQKMMLKCISDTPQNKSQILNKYQQVSKIIELRSILSDNNTNITEKERLCRVFIEKSITEKHRNTQQLIQLFKEFKQPVFNQESALQIKESIMNSLKSINLLKYPSIPPMKLDIQLQKTDLNNGQNKLEIIKNNNNEYEAIVKKQNGYNHFNIVSNEVLKKNVKYIFRMKIQLTCLNDKCFVGLMRNSQINSSIGFMDQLSSCLTINKYGQISLRYDESYCCISKEMQGGDFVLSEENEIEMRICLNEKILEILDYPHYHYKLGLLDKFKDDLINKQNLRLYIGLLSLNNKIVLKEAFFVDKFE